MLPCSHTEDSRNVKRRPGIASLSRLRTPSSKRHGLPCDGLGKFQAHAAERLGIVALKLPWHEHDPTERRIYGPEGDSRKGCPPARGRPRRAALDGIVAWMSHETHYSVLPNSASVEALIFDWDGTLVRSGEINFQAVRKAMLAQKLILDPEWYAPRTSLATRELLAAWEADHHQLPVPHQVIMNYCREYVIAHATDLVVIEEVAAIARMAFDAGLPLAIASNASTRTLAAGLLATKLHPLFAVTVTSSDVKQGKPSPEIFLLAAERLGVSPAACLVYEDAPQGFESAKAAGMRFVDVRHDIAVPSRLA